MSNLIEKRGWVRRVVFIIENDKVGDGWWGPMIAKDLREMAELMDRNIAFHGESESYISDTGNSVTYIAGNTIDAETQSHLRLNVEIVPKSKFEKKYDG